MNCVHAKQLTWNCWLISLSRMLSNKWTFFLPTTISSARIDFGWQFPDVCKQLFFVFLFLFTINKRLMACYFPQSPVQFTSRVLGVLGGDTENISVLGTGIPKTRWYPKHWDIGDRFIRGLALISTLITRPLDRWLVSLKSSYFLLGKETLAQMQW